jgi:hypothetical protein
MGEPKAIEVVIYPKDGKADFLTAEDALEQVRDLIELMKEKELSETEGVAHEWMIVAASTNSPLTIKLAPRLDDNEAADEEVLTSASQAFIEVQNFASQNNVPGWASPKVVSILERMASRIQHKLGPIEVFSAGAQLLEFDRGASVAIEENIRLLNEISGGNLGDHRALGELLGKVTMVGTFRKQNAFFVRVRDGQEIPCVVKTQTIRSFAEKSSWEDIWQGKTIRVFGRKYYNAKGKVTRFEVLREPEVSETRRLNLDGVLDRGFTGGLSVIEHLRMLRGED